jgi:hypothetical protein
VVLNINDQDEAVVVLDEIHQTQQDDEVDEMVESFGWLLRYSIIYEPYRQLDEAVEQTSVEVESVEVDKAEFLFLYIGH